MPQQIEDILENICETDPRYKFDAYEFILDALSYTQKKFKVSRHVTGTQLLEGVKLLLMERYGPMTIQVLNHWGIEGTEDFGRIVFNLVERKVLMKAEDDRIEHFKDAFDFDDVFNKGYRRKLHSKISRLR